MNDFPEIIGYVQERHLPALGNTLTIFTTDPSFGEPVASLVRLSEHEQVVATIESDLQDEKLRRQDEQAKAAGKALRHTQLLRAALAWFEQHEKVVNMGGGAPAVDAMKKLAASIRDALPPAPRTTGGQTA